MYGLPNSPIQFGTKLPKKNPGRRSTWSKFIEKQNDFFPVELYISKIANVDRKGIAASADEGGGPAMPSQAKKLYVSVTRKVSLTPETKDRISA